MFLSSSLRPIAFTNLSPPPINLIFLAIALAISTLSVSKLTLNAIRATLAPTAVQPLFSFICCGPLSGAHPSSFILSKNPSY